MINSEYAAAIFDIALENKSFENFLIESKIIKEVFEDNPLFLKVLKSYNLDLKSKYKIIDNVFGQQINENLQKSLKVIIKNKKTNYLIPIFTKVISFINQELGIDEGVVYSAKKLAPETTLLLEKKMNKIINKKIFLKNIIDTSLIGGLKIIINNKEYDNTITTQVKNLYKHLKEKR